MGATQRMPEVELKAECELDDNWENPREIPPITSGMSDEDKRLLEMIRATTISVAPRAETVELTPPPNGGGPGSEYLKSEVGMNIVVPEGRITELRFKVTLTQVGGADETYATDGFPNSRISNKYIVSGQVKIGISKTFHLIPIIGPVLAQLLSVDFDPWFFHIGSLRRVDVAFSGGLTPKPEWYFKKAGIRNDSIRLAMVLKKSIATTAVKAEVQALWVYKLSVFRKKRLGSDVKTLIIYP